MTLPQTGLVRLFTSSKALAVLAAMIGVLVLLALKIDPAPFVDFVKWAIPAYILGAAAEDAASSIAKRPAALPSQPAVVTTIYPPPPAEAAPVNAPSSTTPADPRERATPVDSFATPPRLPSDVFLKPHELDELEQSHGPPSTTSSLK